MAGSSFDGSNLSNLQSNSLSMSLVTDSSGLTSYAARAHALQVMAVPWHVGHGWTEDTSFMEKVSHIFNDVFPGEVVTNRAYQNTRDLLEGRYNGGMCPVP
jgi:hypothetical protein